MDLIHAEYTLGFLVLLQRDLSKLLLGPSLDCRLELLYEKLECVDCYQLACDHADHFGCPLQGSSPRRLVDVRLRSILTLHVVDRVVDTKLLYNRNPTVVLVSFEGWNEDCLRV